ncbi:MAG TPA: amidohydrolase family protein, partial [Gemmatimonadales bacterium]|nr:amidohydrolase family protein [Gemmatimonadales bacterium]
ELVRAGLTPLEALRAATLSAAEFLDFADRYGSVAPGRRADLVLLEGNPLETIAHTRRIRAVFFGGYHLDRTRLDAMLADVERTAQRPLGPG